MTGKKCVEKKTLSRVKKQKQEVIDQLLPSHTKTSVEYSLVASQKSGPKDLDSKIASFFYENAIPFNVAALSSFALMIMID